MALTGNRSYFMKLAHIRLASLLFVILFAACQPIASPQAAKTGGNAKIKVLAVETFLADITRNIAGQRAEVDSLIPLGMDPHVFQPNPQDVVKIADSELLILNGAGFESWAQETLDNAGGSRLVIEASAGLSPREPKPDEESHDHEAEAPEENAHEHAIDPHFWLDPLQVIRYAENIRDGLIQADPAGKDEYTSNTVRYIAQLKELDGWIRGQIETIPPEKRIIVTNHESFGYFADRYGLRIVGTVIPSISTDSAPSAMQMAKLVDVIRQTGVSAVFVESGANLKLADQVAQETGVKVISDLYTHSITTADGVAPSYISMMQHNVRAIVEGLK